EPLRPVRAALDRLRLRLDGRSGGRHGTRPARRTVRIHRHRRTSPHNPALRRSVLLPRRAGARPHGRRLLRHRPERETHRIARAVPLAPERHGTSARPCRKQERPKASGPHRTAAPETNRYGAPPKAKGADIQHRRMRYGSPRQPGGPTTYGIFRKRSRGCRTTSDTPILPNVCGPCNTFGNGEHRSPPSGTEKPERIHITTENRQCTVTATRITENDDGQDARRTPPPGSRAHRPAISRKHKTRTTLYRKA